MEMAEMIIIISPVMPLCVLNFIIAQSQSFLLYWLNFKSNSTAHNQQMAASSGASMVSEKFTIHTQRILDTEKTIPAVMRSYPLQFFRV